MPKFVRLYFVLSYILLFLFTLAITLTQVNTVFADYAECTSLRCWDKSIADWNTKTGAKFGELNCTPPTLGGSYCDRTLWKFYRNPFCKQVSYPDCDASYNPTDVYVCDWEYDECNAADRCYGATTAGTGSGSDATGRVVPGKCDEQLGCISGTSQYKQCCSAGGLIPTTSCVDGTCPSGQDCNKNCFTF